MSELDDFKKEAQTYKAKYQESSNQNSNLKGINLQYKKDYELLERKMQDADQSN